MKILNCSDVGSVELKSNRVYITTVLAGVFCVHSVKMKERIILAVVVNSVVTTSRSFSD